MAKIISTRMCEHTRGKSKIDFYTVLYREGKLNSLAALCKPTLAGQKLQTGTAGVFLWLGVQCCQLYLR
jgi:hypothetical protein